jgi:hypothetical protein
MTIPLPELTEPDIFTFVLERLLVDLRRAVGAKYPARGDGRLVVAYVTHTEYYDEARRAFVCDPPTRIVDKTAVAEIPSISMGRFIWTRNRMIYSEGYSAIPTSWTAEDDSKACGLQKRNPVEFLDVQVTMRLFENKPQELTRLQRLVFQYFDLHPYLFIPADLRDRSGVTDPCVLMRLCDQWFKGEDLEVPGIFVKQGIPIEQTVFTSNIRASIDNLFTAETTILVEEIPAPDGLALANMPLVQDVDVGIYEYKLDEPDVLVASIDLEESEE